jgi:hypothetical protein
MIPCEKDEEIVAMILQILIKSFQAKNEHNQICNLENKQNKEPHHSHVSEKDRLERKEMKVYCGGCNNVRGDNRELEE